MDPHHLFIAFSPKSPDESVIQHNSLVLQSHPKLNIVVGDAVPQGTFLRTGNCNCISNIP